MDTAFYDSLAPFYHLLYQDWEASIERQAGALATALREHGVAPGAQVLDAACGIGTQAIGLARRGFRVRASDASPGAVARAREELRRRGLEVEVAVADLRDLASVHPGGFSAVVGG